MAKAVKSYRSKDLSPGPLQVPQLIPCHTYIWIIKDTDFIPGSNLVGMFVLAMERFIHHV